MQRNLKFWEESFKNIDIPETHKNAIKRIFESYPLECMPRGICDAVYILNVFCKELGIGDGQNNFYKYKVIK